MKAWKANVGLGLSVGVGLMVIILLVDAGLIWLAASRPLSIGTFLIGLAVMLSLGLLGLIGYWTYGLAVSGYFLDRNALVIQWGPAEQVIPTSQIERVFVGEEIEAPVLFHGGRWPGHWVGYGEIPDLGQALFYATVPPQQQIYVATPGLIYGISPADRDDFLRSLQRRLAMGPTQLVTQISKRPNFLEWSIWRDWLGLALLGAGFLALLVLIGLLCFRFPSLPLLVPLHFDAVGKIDRLGPRSQIFILPLIGLLALLINSALGFLAYRRERVASLIVWAGMLFVQMLTWVAVIGILGRL
jgi:hypothetical protein